MKKQKRTRKKQKRLEIRIQAISVPKGMSSKQYLRALLRGISSGELPRGVGAVIQWRNPDTMNGATKEWQPGEFLETLSESSPGFSTVVRNAILRRLH